MGRRYHGRDVGHQAFDESGDLLDVDDRRQLDRRSFEAGRLLPCELSLRLGEGVPRLRRNGLGGSPQSSSGAEGLPTGRSLRAGCLDRAKDPAEEAGDRQVRDAELVADVRDLGSLLARLLDWLFE